MSCEELRKVSDLGREGILQSVSSSGDQLDDLLYAATMKEVLKGFLVRDINVADIPAGATLTRRFGVRQKKKIRPIDDYKSSFVNCSVTQSETASAHTVDHIAALVSCVLRTSKSRGRPIRLMWKIWDLADACKQVPLSDAAYMI